MNPYPAYTPSGLPWLGDAPAHWEMKRLKHWVRINASVLHETTSADYEFDYLDIGTVGTGVLMQRPQRMRFGTAPSRARRILTTGDTIVSTVRTYLKAVYFIGGAADRLIASTGFAVLTPRAGIHPKFVSYVAQSDSFTNQVTAESVGIAYPAIAETKLGRFFVAVPPLDEQRAIARYLAHHDALTRRYIRAKQKMIALLDEQKQAIVHRAVTRGLDPNVKLKPSGVTWLGEVPEHWDIRPAKLYYREIDERSTTGQEELLSVSHITGVTPRSQKNVTMFMAESYEGHKICRPGDLVINTMWAWMAALGVSNQTGIVSPSYAVYRPLRKNAFAPSFVDFLLRTKPFVNEYVCLSTGIRSSRLRLYPEQFLRVRLLRPPLDEQLQILAYIQDATENINRAIAHAQGEIALLREYRTRLIADVVTGKVDVRDATAGLGEEDLTGLQDLSSLVEDATEEVVESEAADADMTQVWEDANE